MTFYVCTAGGGLWKSTDNGTTLVPIFDNYLELGTASLKTEVKVRKERQGIKRVEVRK